MNLFIAKTREAQSLDVMHQVSVTQLLEKYFESIEFSIQVVENDASMELDHAQEIMQAFTEAYPEEMENVLEEDSKQTDFLNESSLLSIENRLWHSKWQPYLTKHKYSDLVGKSL